MKYEEVPYPIRLLAKVGFIILLSAYILVELPGIPPTSDFKSYTVSPKIPLEGKLKPQNVLDKAVKLADGEFKGAESIVIKGDHLYFGTHGGSIIKLNKNQNSSSQPEYTVITNYEKPCENGEHLQCGATSPLGIRFDSQGNLVIVDGKYGILNINPSTGQVNKLCVSMKDPIDGRLCGFPDDLDIGKDGSIYWSDLESSGGGMNMADSENMNGRLIKTDSKTNEHTVLIRGLAGGNGVQLSENEDFVLICESFRSRVWRYYLKGPNAGTSDVFVDSLPGFPDNIRPNGKGGFFLALFSPRCALIDELSEYPQLRKLFAKLRTLMLIPLGLLNGIGIQNHYLTELMEYIFFYGPLGFDMAAKPVVLDLDANGNIERVMSTENNKEFLQVTQMTIDDNHAFLGGFSSEQIWKIPRADLNAKSN